MPSIESNAVEPSKDELRGLSTGQKLVRLAPTYGLVSLMVALIVLFSVLLPNTFPTVLNVRSILSDKAIIALLALAAMIPMVAGRIDLTVGYGMVLWHILAISLQTLYGLPWPVAGGRCRGAGAWRHHGRSERPVGRGGADRQLYRHAGHGHSALCAGAVAYRWAANGGHLA